MEMRWRSPGSSLDHRIESESINVIPREPNMTEPIVQNVRGPGRLEGRHPGTVALGYLTRSTCESSPDRYPRSKSQGGGPKSYDTFKACGGEIRRPTPRQVWPSGWEGTG